MFMPTVLSHAITVFISAFIGWLFSRRKQKADAEKAELENVSAVMTMWRTTAEELYKQVAHLTNRCEQLTSRCEELTNELEGMRRENNKLRSELKRLEKTINQSIQ